MRIFVIGRSFPDSRRGSMGVFELEQAEALHRQGHETVYLFSDNQSPRDVHQIGKLSQDCGGVPCIGSYCPAGLKLFSLYTALKTKKLRWALEQAEKQYGKPDVIHIHFPLLTLTEPLWRELKQKGCPLIVTEHWSRVQNRTVPKKLLPLQEKVYRQADAMLVVGQGIYQALEMQFGANPNMQVVPNMVGSEFCLPEREKKTEGPFVFLYAGRLAPEKRVDWLVRAFDGAFHNAPNMELHIIGPGPERRRLERLIRARKLQDHVKLIGGVPNGEVAARMKQADCIVTASKCETFCVPIAESWMCGKPAVFPSNLPVAAYMAPALGKTFVPDDLDALRSAMEAVYRNKAENRAEKIAAFAREHFSEQALCLRLEAIYRESLKMRKP